MSKLNKFSAVVVIALFSFLGGIVGGGLSQTYLSDGQAQELNVNQDGVFRQLTADALVVHQIFTSSVDILDKDFNSVGTIQDNGQGGASIFLGSHDKKQKQFKTMLAIGSGSEGCVISLKDVDGDGRIVMGVNKREPSLSFVYNGLSRLTLGTNEVTTSATGDDHTYKGSIFAFDKNNKATDSLPKY
ncbi:hypothetical protein [Desulfovibrio gilichinskyi]|uniref:Uncharacterized protein n=1 Tax=Desulfovibrio gilichinskyi TaxID=1519643 RepID=A0A1X7C3R0_9BACT|nr:hypothetical protein [Desulfovibrio gilichinskyi]SME89462.1 hypothetical protein SAMN06295933_0305 [Desulfovibrio gilichinskyi]